MKKVEPYRTYIWGNELDNKWVKRKNTYSLSNLVDSIYWNGILRQKKKPLEKK